MCAHQDSCAPPDLETPASFTKMHGRGQPDADVDVERLPASDRRLPRQALCLRACGRQPHCSAVVRGQSRPIPLPEQTDVLRLSTRCERQAAALRRRPRSHLLGLCRQMRQTRRPAPSLKLHFRPSKRDLLYCSKSSRCAFKWYIKSSCCEIRRGQGRRRHPPVLHRRWNGDLCSSVIFGSMLLILLPCMRSADCSHRLAPSPTQSRSSALLPT